MIKLLISVLLGMASASAWAFPERVPFNALQTHVSPQIQSAQYDFNGIVTLSNCSASLVHFVGQPMTSKAYVLTNGHCISSWGGFLRPGEVRWNRRTRRSMKVHRSVNSTVRGTAYLLAYAAMTDTDAALYRLNETYEYFASKGIQSLELSSQRPIVNDKLEIISGYWKTGFRCFIESFVHELHEGGWVFKDSVRYSSKGCEVYGGTSGSPVLAEGQRRVVAVNNTGNESGRMCTNNNP